MSTAVLVHSKDCYKQYTLNCLAGIYRTFEQYKDVVESPSYKGDAFMLQGSVSNIYVTTEKEPLEFFDAKNIITGDGFWSDRLKLALEAIPDDDVILFLEDMIIQYSNPSMVKSAISFHERENAIMTKLGNHAWFASIPTNLRYGRYHVLKQTGGLYIMSHQPVTIFDRKYLLSTLESGQTPWQHECDTSSKYRESGCPDGIYIFSDPQRKLVEHETPGTDLGSIIIYHHALSKGEEIEYKGKYK